MSIVLDASVLAKLYFPEPDSEAAHAAVRDAGSRLVAPDLLWAELASIAWKKLRRGDITHELAAAVLAEAMQLPIEIHPIGDYIERAFTLASETDRTVYDCLYLAIAIAENVPVLSADKRFVNAITAGPFASHVRLVGA